MMEWSEDTGTEQILRASTKQTANLSTVQVLRLRFKEKLFLAMLFGPGRLKVQQRPMPSHRRCM